LLQAISNAYPKDQIDIVCSKYSDFQPLDGLPNFEILPFGRERAIEFYRLLLGVGKLRRIASIRNADVIWSINLGCYFPGELPHVISIHNSYQVYPWSYTKYHPDSRLHVAILRWFFRKSLYISDGVIVQTPAMAEYIKKIERAPKQIAIIPKAVEASKENNHSSLPLDLQIKLREEIGKKSFTFIYVATFLAHKNHKVLVKAFDLLASLRLNVRLILTISMDELITIGGETAKNLVEGDYLIPIGWVKKENLKALYRISDACLMPSMLESLSSAHLEAMEWGKPQITSDLLYSRDICGNAAFYASAEDPSDWAQKIQLLIQDKSFREKLVIEGQERIKAFPKQWNEAAMMVRSFLEEIVEKKALISHS
jgi:glycosyltransferase involved in cell wall biosynthesis